MSEEAEVTMVSGRNQTAYGKNQTEAGGVLVTESSELATAFHTICIYVIVKCMCLYAYVNIPLNLRSDNKSVKIL